MSLKRVDFVNAPSSSIGTHQRYMIGVGLDPLVATSNKHIALKTTTSKILILSSNNNIVLI